MYTAGVFAMMIAIPKRFIGIVNIFTGEATRTWKT
jgi:hypothetical protein